MGSSCYVRSAYVATRTVIVLNTFSLLFCQIAVTFQILTNFMEEFDSIENCN